MKKRIIFGILAFIIGIGISLFSYSFFREQIQNIFLWSTSNRIRFTGKNFYLFGSNFYSLSIGISLLVLTLENLNQRLAGIFKNGIICLLTFGISLIGISAIDANIKVIECTACDDGMRSLHWNGINYGVIIGISAIISIIPSLIKTIKRTKKASVQHRI
jgi:hypothetical protein